MIALVALAAGCRSGKAPPPATPAPGDAATDAAPGRPAPFDPQPSWSDDGKWILWRTRDLEQTLLARSSDLVPRRSWKTFSVDFVGSWVGIEDEMGTALEAPEDGRKIGTLGHAGALVVTPSAVASFAEGSLRLLTRPAGVERTIALPLCQKGDRLVQMTAAARSGDIVAFDIECRAEGAPACKGARGNCESRADAAALFDAKVGTMTPLAAGFWAGADVVAFSPDGRMVAVLGQAHTDTLVLADARSGRVVRNLKLVPDGIVSMGGCAAWTADASVVYLVTSSGIWGFHARTGARVARRAPPEEGSSFEDLSSCTARVEGQQLLVAGVLGAHRWQLPKLEETAGYPRKDEEELTVSPDARRIVVRRRESGAPPGTTAPGHVVDTATMRSISTGLTLPVGGSVVVDPTSSLAAVADVVVDLRTGRVAGTLRATPP